MTRLPIRVRLTLAFAVTMAIVLAGVGLLVYHRVDGELLASVDQTLRLQASEAASHAHAERVLVDPDAAGGATLAQLLDSGGHVLRSQPTAMPPLVTPGQAARVAAGASLLRTIRISSGSDNAWRALAVPVDGGGVIVVARSLAAREDSLDKLGHELELILPLALLVASLAGYALAAGALRPVEAMRRRAAAVTAAAPGRLPVPRSRDEVSRLALTLNDMLERLQASFEHERRFVSDASHELRTPLALLRAELELALRRPRSREQLEEALRSAAEETERLSRLAEDLLLIARADQGGMPLRPERVAAGEVLATVAGRFSTLARRLGRVVLVEDSDALLDADPLRVEQALGNLVDNALTYGEGRVVLSATERDGVVELHVQDEGAGFRDDFRERAFDRFSRGDDARARDGATEAGAGLGLSIVDLIARAHGTRAGIRNRPEGGADVWIAIPRGRRGGVSEPRPAASSPLES